MKGLCGSGLAEAATTLARTARATRIRFAIGLRCTGKSACATGKNLGRARQCRAPTTAAFAAAQSSGVNYKMVWRVTRAPGLVPKPLPLRGTPLTKAPLPVLGNGAGPALPPPVAGVGGEPKLMGAEGSEPMYCEYARQ